MIDKEYSKNWGLASNEICIDRRVGSTMVDLDMFVNGNYTTKVTGDGLLVATPTGSTGY